MHNHCDENYLCPFCSLVDGTVIPGQESTEDDVIHRDGVLTAFISSTDWEGNLGRVLIVPNSHIENIYDIDEGTLAAIGSFARRIALALKEVYGCDGTTIRQHNEPASNQSVLHFHTQVIPRYAGDNFYPRHREKIHAPAENRAENARRLREYLSKH